MGVFLPLLVPDRCGVRITDVNESAIPTTIAANSGYAAGGSDGPGMEPRWQSIVLAMAASGPERLRRVWVAQDRPSRADRDRGRITGVSPATTGSRDRLAFAQVQWDSHLYRFNGPLPVDEVAPSSGFETDPHFSPDGRRLAFGSGRSGTIQIWVSAADGSNPRQLTAHAGFGLARMVAGWALDRLRQRGRRRARPHLDRRRGRRHATPDHERSRLPVGATMVGRRQVDLLRRTIWGRRETSGGRAATGGVSQQITRTGSGFVGYEFGDGTSLLYQPAHGDSALLLMPLAGGTGPRRLVECVRCASFAPAGGIVVYVPCDPSSRPPLRAIDPLSGKDRLLGRLVNFPPGAMHVNLAVSPDGNTILFRGLVGRSRSGDLMLIENFR